MNTTKHDYTIRTDDGLMEGIEASSVAEALQEFGVPSDVQTAEQFREWLESVGGYGWIEQDGERLVAVGQ